MFTLAISDSEGKTTRVPLARDEITIGRTEGNTIRLTDRNVSRRHARLKRHNGNYLLQDLNSYNGVVINGARLVEPVRPLKHGDEVLIGDYKLAIFEVPSSEIALPPRRTPAPEEPTAVLETAGAAPRVAPVADTARASTWQATGAAMSSAVPSARAPGVEVVFPAPSSSGSPARRSATPVILGVLGGGVVLGLAAFFALRPRVTTPHETRAAVAVPRPAEPAVVSARSDAPSQPPGPSGATVGPGDAPVARAEVPANDGQGVPEAPVEPGPAPRRHARSADGPPRASAQQREQDALDHARDALRVGDDAGAITALAGNVRSELGWGLLAATYRHAGRRDQAERAMRHYLSRWPQGPRAASFRAFLGSEAP